MTDDDTNDGTTDDAPIDARTGDPVDATTDGGSDDGDAADELGSVIAESETTGDGGTASDDRTASDGGTAGGAPAETDDDDGALDVADGEKLVTYLHWALFSILVLVMLMATLRFYGAASETIRTFVSDRYRSLFMALFNLAIILFSGLGLSVLVRRMT